MSRTAPLKHWRGLSWLLVTRDDKMIWPKSFQPGLNSSQDWDDFRQTAHSFKGSCGNMGALALQQACEEAERAGSTANPQAAQASYEKVQHSFERIVPLLGL